MVYSIEKIEEKHFICVGDIMLDVFQYGKMERISPEAPAPVVRIEKIEERIGGVGNVVKNLLDLGAKVSLVSMIGNDTEGQKIASMLEDYDKLEAYLFVDQEYKTTSKTRIIAANQHVVRLDEEKSSTYYNADIENQAISLITELLATTDALIFSDYNKGFITKKMKFSTGVVPSSAIKIADTKTDLSSFVGLDFITPNVKELEIFSGIKIHSEKDIHLAVDTIYSKFGIPNVLVTRGDAGMMLFEKVCDKPKLNALVKNEAVWNIIEQTAHSGNVVDVCGAGDTVVANFALCKALGFNSEKCVDVASVAACIVVEKPGTESCSIEEINLSFEKRKKKNNPNVSKKITLNLIAGEKKLGKRIGFINGCFDILHDGHIDLFSAAKQSCDILVVAINSDKSIKSLESKGKDRPFLNEKTRKKILSSIKHIDHVLVFDEATPLETIEKVLPNVVFKGMDYKDKEIPEQTFLNDNNIQLKLIKTNDIHSSDIIGKIREK